MPQNVRRSGRGQKVFGPSGPLSKKPLSFERAQAQQRAVQASERRSGKFMGGISKRRRSLKRRSRKSKTLSISIRPERLVAGRFSDSPEVPTDSSNLHFANHMPVSSGCACGQ